MKIFLIFLSAMLVNNFVLSRSLGICPVLGVSKKLKPAMGMGLAVTFVVTMSSMITYGVYHWLLVPLKLEYLYTIAFILVIAALVQFVEMVVQKTSPVLYKTLGVYLPLITTNCIVLGVAVLNKDQNYSLLESTFHGLGAALGFTLAIILFAGIRERLENNKIPVVFQGLPIALIAAGLMSIAFLGFQGLI